MTAREQMSPAQWLAHVRSDMGLAEMTTFTDAWLETLIGSIPQKDREAARRVWLERRGKPQADLHDELMSQYLKWLLPYLTPKERNVADGHFFALVPTYELNAHHGKTPRGDRLIVLHHTLFYTIAFLTHLYMRLLLQG